MREFMTRVSDYLSERREDPERKEDRLSLVVIGAVAVVIIVLVLLLLWGYTTTQEKKQRESEKRMQELLQEQMEEQELTAVTYEEQMEDYMSQNAGEELRQEYLTSTGDLGEKVKELQTTLEQVQKEVEKVISENQGEGQKEKLTQLNNEVETVLEKVREMEAKYADLSDLIRTMDQEKVTMIQKQLQVFQEELEQVRADVAGIHEKIAALEKEDKALWEKLSGVEQRLATVLEKDLEEIDRRMDGLSGDIGDLEKRMKASLEQMRENMEKEMVALAEEGLAYRYEQKTNTLYLMPNLNPGAKTVQAKGAEISSQGAIVYRDDGEKTEIYAADILFLKEKLDTIPDEVFSPLYYTHARQWEYNDVNDTTYTKYYEKCGDGGQAEEVAMTEAETTEPEMTEFEMTELETDGEEMPGEKKEGSVSENSISENTIITEKEVRDTV